MAVEAEAPVEPARDPNLGKVIAGRYRITSRLGGGGMGVVYLAEHAAIGKRVALKMLHSQFATDKEVVRRFLNEARAAALVNHRNIVDALDFGQTEEGAPYLVLEYLEGHDLGQALLDGPMSVERAATICAQVASALQAAHDKGIVHRDLKPENVYLVDDEPETQAVRVLDFGISKVTGGVGGTATGMAMGTPQYMAPEQFLDAARADARSDIYSLGAMLYQMLSGKLPIDEPSFGAMAIAVMQRRPVPLRKLRPEVPEDLASLVDSMITREADSRPGAMVEVARRLGEFATPGEARASMTADRPRRSSLVGDAVRGPDTHIALKGVGGLQKPSSSVLVPVGVAAVLLLIALAWWVGGASTVDVGAPDVPHPTTVEVPPESPRTTTEAVEPAAPVTAEIPRALDPPAEVVEPEVVSRVRQARERGDVRGALTALSTSQRHRDQLSPGDVELISALCEDTLRLSESRLDVDPSESLRLARLVSQLSLASDAHRARAETIGARAQSALDTRTRAVEAERVRAQAEAAEAARRATSTAPQTPPTTAVGRRTRQLESENPY